VLLASVDQERVGDWPRNCDIHDHNSALSHTYQMPGVTARVRWQRTTSLMAVGAYRQAQTLMDQVRDDLGDDLTSMDGPTLSVYGSSHLRSAILAARASRATGPGSAQEAWAHVEAARDVANQMGGDRNDYGLAFGPSNVAQHEIAVAVELEDGAEAVRRAARIKFPNSMPPVRRGSPPHRPG
jgi:hypothetical protein